MELNKSIIEYLQKTKDPIVFEFGAHNGSDLIALNKLLDGRGKIYGWEVDPELLKILRAMKLPNNVEIIEKAISDRDGTVKFHLAISTNKPDKRYCGSSSLLKPIYSPRRPKYIKFVRDIMVPTQTLDSFCKERKIEEVDLIAADIQGAEPLMIKGGQETLKRTKFISIELMGDKRYEDMITEKEEILSLLPEGWTYVCRLCADVVFENQLV